MLYYKNAMSKYRMTLNQLNKANVVVVRVAPMRMVEIDINYCNEKLHGNEQIVTKKKFILQVR